MANIQLVIKIDEDTCHRIVSGFSDEDDAVLFANLLKKGTPLPKGHGRLIDADKLIPDLDYENGSFYAVSMTQINGTLTIVEEDKEE